VAAAIILAPYVLVLSERPAIGAQALQQAPANLEPLVCRFLGLAQAIVFAATTTRFAPIVLRRLVVLGVTALLASVFMMELLALK